LEGNAMKYGLVIGFLLLFAGTAAYAQEPRPADVNTEVEAMAGNNVLQLRYLAPSPWDLNGTRSDLDYGFLFTESRDIVGSAALMFHTNLNIIPGLKIDVGPKGYLALLSAVNKTDVFAAAIGADARYPLPLLNRWGLSAFGSAFYSPGVLTFGNAHNIYDFTAGADLAFTSRFAAMAGYRWFKFTLVAEPSRHVDNELFVGLRWTLR
jgi:YfaZ precursor